jgi:hypothetical protein
MRKFAAPAVLLSLALSTVGCEMNRPPAQAPDVAWNTYKGRLAEQCEAKHLENLPAEKFGEIAHDYYIDADTQIQQLVDFDARKVCSGKNTVDAECFNTGMVQALVQTGGTQDFVKKVCAKAGSPTS